jgi:hypothetical protein
MHGFILHSPKHVHDIMLGWAYGQHLFRWTWGPSWIMTCKTLRPTVWGLRNSQQWLWIFLSCDVGRCDVNSCREKSTPFTGIELRSIARPRSSQPNRHIGWTFLAPITFQSSLSVSHKIHCVSVTKTGRSLRPKEVTGVYSKSRKNATSRMYGRDVEFLNVETGRVCVVV